MATTSTIPTVCQALVSLLRAAMPTVQVEWGRPASTAIQRKTVFIRDVDTEVRIPTMKAGRKERDESYDVNLILADVVPRGTPADAQLSVLAMYDELDGLLATDPTLGGLDGVMWARFASGRLTAEATNEGAVALFDVTASVRARLV